MNVFDYIKLSTNEKYFYQEQGAFYIIIMDLPRNDGFIHYLLTS